MNHLFNQKNAIRKRLDLFFSLLTIFFFVSSSVAQTVYFPKQKWESKQPSDLQMNSLKLSKAVDFAKQHEYSKSRDLRIAIYEGFRKEPFINIVGPTKRRGGPAGLVIKNGYIVAQWGDLNRVDMTFSVTKSYLSTVFGLALDQGLIRSVNDKVSDYVWDGTFDGKHNSSIEWKHLLTQSSDWSGTLFGQYDWADRPPAEGNLDDWKNRELKVPGTFFEYNDVRVNVTAYALMQVWRRPLPQILKEKIMDPIGASTTWRWNGYKNSWVNLDGLSMQSVSGGGHSGGGVFINTLDQARFGYLFLRNGNWAGHQLISRNWIKAIQQSSPANESYGYMWWLNRAKRYMEDVPDNVFYAAGFGGNYIVVDQKNDLLIVTRWLEPSQLGAFLKLIYQSLD